MSITLDDFKPLETFIDVEQFRADTSIDQADLNTAMSQQVALYAYYSTLIVKAKLQRDKAEQLLEYIEAKLDQKYRDILEAEGKVTEPKVKARLITDPLYRKARERLIEAESIYKHTAIADRAFEHRREMLKRIAEDQARERMPSMRTMEHRERGAQFLETMRKAASGAGSAD